MFTYQCPHCGKQHTNASDFVQEFQTKCLRCAQPFGVTAQMIQAGRDNGSPPAQRQHAITTPPPGAGSISNKAPGAEVRNNHLIQAGDTDPATAGPAVALDEAEEAGGKSGKKGKKQKGQPAPSAEESEGEQEALDADDASEEEKEEADRAAKRAVAQKALDEMKKPAAKEKAGKKKALLAVGIVVPILLLLGVVGYFIFLRKGKGNDSAKNKAKARAPVVAKKPAPPPKKIEEKKVDPKLPVFSPPRAVDFILSAPRLAADHLSDPAGTDAKFNGAWVEVVGLFDKLETVKAAKGTPLVRAFFQTGRGSVSCDLSGILAGEMKQWQAFRPGQALAVRGFYGKGAALSKCVLAEPTAIADAKFKGKTIEVTGAVEAVLLPGAGVEFPTIAFEGETNSPLTIHCLFQKADLQYVKPITAGASLTIQGVCDGRRTDAKKAAVVVIHNCEFVSTTGPKSSIPRMAAADLTRSYEEDLRPYFLPPRGKEEEVATPLTVTELSKAWKVANKNLDKYRHRVVTVSGRVAKKGAREVVLESSETDQPLRVACHFSREVFDALADLPQFRIRGLFTGQEGPQTLRLDNCGVDASQLQSAFPRLTADYLPHKPGRIMTYDMATFPPAVKAAVVERQVWYQRAGGQTETVITNTARFPGKSLFTTGKAETWTAARASRVRVPGPGYTQKNSVGMVEFGPRTILPRATRVLLAPVLKPGARPGDSWEWVLDDSKHVYTLERLDKWMDKPSAVVNVVIVTPLSKYKERQVRHVYVRGVGEVERLEWVRISSTEKKLIQEKKLVSIDAEGVAEKKTGP